MLGAHGETRRCSSRAAVEVWEDTKLGSGWNGNSDHELMGMLVAVELVRLTWSDCELQHFGKSHRVV